MRTFCASVILFICMLCMSTRSYGQRYLDEYNVFYGGLVGGLNFTQVDGDNFAGYHKVGFNAGAIVYARLDEHVAASMELLFSQKGSRSTLTQGILNGVYITDYKIKLNYAEVPILINYFDKHHSHFGGGLSFGQLASSSESITTVPNQNYDLSKYPFKKIDLNIVLNGNLHLYKGLFYNLRFQYSLISIRDNIPTDNGNRGQFNNMWV